MPAATSGSATDLAVMPSTRVTPSRVTDSTLYSGPSRSRSSRASRSSGWSRVLRSGPVTSAKATARPASSVTLRTPVPEFMSTGLTTSGYPRLAASLRACSQVAATANGTSGTPAAASAPRTRCLRVAVRSAPAGAPGRPSAPATTATAGR